MDPTADDPLSRLLTLLCRAQLALVNDGNRIAAWWGLTAAQWTVLAALAEAERPLSAAALSRRLGLSRQAAAKQLRLLLKRGMVVREADPRDARAPQHRPSADGRAAHLAVAREIGLRRAELAASVPPRQLDICRTTLETLLHRLGDAGATPPPPTPAPALAAPAA